MKSYQKIIALVPILIGFSSMAQTTQSPESFYAQKAQEQRAKDSEALKILEKKEGWVNNPEYYRQEAIKNQRIQDSLNQAKYALLAQNQNNQPTVSGNSCTTNLNTTSNNRRLNRRAQRQQNLFYQQPLYMNNVYSPIWGWSQPTYYFSPYRNYWSTPVFYLGNGLYIR